MKRIIAFLLTALILISMAACGESGEKEWSKTEYSYDAKGNITEVRHYELSDVSGQYYLTFLSAYSYQENGLLSEKLFYDYRRADVERVLVQRNTYVYDEAGKLQTLYFYNEKGSQFGTTEYTYAADGSVQKKEEVYTEPVVYQGFVYNEDGEGTGKIVIYEFQFFDDQGGNPIARIERLDSEPEEGISYRRITEYYDNGTEKTHDEYLNTIRLDRSEYPEVSNFGKLEDLILGKDEEFYRADELRYKPAGDGTYETIGTALTRHYHYDQNGTLEYSIVYDKSGNAIYESYYPSGALRGRTEREYEPQFSWLMHEKSEEWYEGGALLAREETVYQLDSEHNRNCVYQYREEFYEDGMKKSVMERKDSEHTIGESYYPSGALQTRTVYEWDSQTETVASEKIEEWYESGALLAREENAYYPLGWAMKRPWYQYREEFYESGGKKSIKEIDSEKEIDSYTEWDEEGNVITSKP